MKKTTIGVGLAVIMVFGMGVMSFSHALADNGNEGGNPGSGGSEHAQGVNVGIGPAVSAAVHAVQNGNDSAETKVSGVTKESLSVDANGDFSITGATVVSVDTGANTITGTLYGITKTVNVAGATITAHGNAITLSNVQPGDTVSVKGTFNAATHTVSVANVDDVSYAARNNADIQSRINQLLQLVAQLQAQLRTMQNASSSQ